MIQRKRKDFANGSPINPNDVAESNDINDGVIHQNNLL
jgi:hypothetical protein